MNRRKEPCRNFLRGSCQYGDRCKFLHQNPQQSKPAFGFGTQSNLQSNNATTQQRSNPFGFGTQSNPSPSQPQKPNPFGFGVQSNSMLNQQQQKNPFGFGSNANAISAKPFENKWTRNSSPSTNLTTKKTDAPAASHKCTDPESCKSQIIEDFKNEAPLWKLTCYGHLKYGPCDIIGDISYEELRFAAYEDAKKGLSLQSIVSYLIHITPLSCCFFAIKIA